MSSSSATTSKQQSSDPTKVTGILFVINAFQMLFWTGFVFVPLTNHYAYTAIKLETWNWSEIWNVGYPSFYNSRAIIGDYGYQLAFMQSFALLDILTVLLGYIKSGLFTTVMQVFSRLWLVWVILPSSVAAQTSPAFSTMVFAWGLTEIIRYNYYTVSQAVTPPYWMAWMRYTFFIFLYPIGVASELYCIYLASEQTENQTTRYILLGSMVAYLPGFPMLYLHMFGQRKKVLGRYQAFVKPKTE